MIYWKKAITLLFCDAELETRCDGNQDMYERGEILIL